MADDFPTVKLLGWSFAALSEQHCVDYISRELEAGRGGWVVTPNVDHFRRLVRDATFAALYKQATFSVADGMPLVWAARLQRTPLPERVPGSNLVSTLSAEAARQGRSVFLLGGESGTAEGVAKVLRNRHPGLKIAGTCCPMIGGNPDKGDAEVVQVADMLRLTQPDIVYVALGSPKQEILISRLRDLLPRTWWLGVGISFSYLCGRVRRAPRWVREAGFEWLYRMAQEPRRLAGRYLRDDLPFCIHMLLGAAVRGTGKTLFKPAKD